MRQAAAHAQGRKVRGMRITTVEIPDVKAIRRALHMSQQRFAAAFRIPLPTLKNWEQGRRKPEGPARVLLQVAAKHPEVLWDAIQPAPKRASKKGRQVQND